MNEYQVRPIGTIQNGKDGIFIKLFPEYVPGLEALDGFSHINVLWWFSNCDNPADRCIFQAEQPYKNAPAVMGVFATRSPLRPNPIALTASEIIKIDADQGVIQLDYIDADNGTPLFLLSKLAVFLLSDLAFAVLLTLLNVGLNDGAAVLPAVLLQTAILSLMMALVGLLCALLLKDFRQFTLAYLVIAIFAATPVFLSANTSIKFDWIGYHPFYHVYMGLKNAYFGTDISPAYYAGAAGVIALLFLVVRLAFHREIGKEG